MSKHIYNPHTNTDLLKNDDYKNYLIIVTQFGAAQSGGFSILSLPVQAARLVQDVNLLIPRERKQLIYSESISKN